MPKVTQKSFRNSISSSGGHKMTPKISEGESSKANRLEFKGCAMFRIRLVLATLTGKTIHISNIRSSELNPGLTEYEASFLRLLEKVTNGSKISISYTGTALTYVPGQIIGGSWTHDCAPSKTIGYYLEPLIIMAPFAKEAFRITLNGITHSCNLEAEESVDYGLEGLSTILVPMMEKFGIDSKAAELVIKERCYARPKQPSKDNNNNDVEGQNINGKVFFTCPIIQDQLKPVNLTDLGRIQKIRGIAHSMNLSSSQVNRMIDGMRSVLNRFIPDIFITSDCKGRSGTGSQGRPGYGLFLTSTSTTGQKLGVQGTAGPGLMPENFAVELSHRLLFEIERAGYVDTSLAPIPLIWMALSSADVSQIRLGPLSPYCVQVLRLIRKFTSVMFKIEPVPFDQTLEEDEDGDGEESESLEGQTESLLLTVVGCDLRNNNRKIK